MSSDRAEQVRMGGVVTTSDRAATSVRVTSAQADLLAELAETGGLYISGHMRFARTAAALEKKGLAHITEHDYSRLQQDRYEITDAGRAWLNGRT